MEGNSSSEIEFVSLNIAMMTLNQAMADSSISVKAGDEVAFFPPVTGG